MLNRLKLSTKMVALGVGGAICFSFVLTWVYFKIEAKVYESKRAMIKNVTEVTFNLVAEYEARVKSGELSLDEAQKRAALRVKNLRYSGQEYFWINDLGPKMVMHPFKPELDGKGLEDFKDPNGKALFVEFVNTCKEKGEGFVDYMWPKPGEAAPVPKISFVKLFKPWGWIVGSGVYIDDIRKELAEFLYIFLGSAFLIISTGFLASWSVARSTTRPINLAVERLTSNADYISAATVSMTEASHQLAEGASEQAAAIEETSSSLEEIASMTKKNAENAAQADQFMKETNRIVERANGAMRELTSSMEEVSRASEATQKIVKTIDEVAFQTNLLALNAAVEAARAGEAGAGFAVVADEVRNLAMRAGESSKNTAVLIEDIVKRIRIGAQLAGQTNGEFDDVKAMVTKSGELIGEIAAASIEQAQGIEHLNQAVHEMDKVVQQNAAAAEETASLAREMHTQTDMTKEMTASLAGLIGECRGNRRDEIRRTLPNEPASRKETKSTVAKANAAGRPLLASRMALSSRRTAYNRRSEEITPDKVIPFDDESFQDF